MEPLAFISDLHANPSAVEAVLADIGVRGIERVFCLGDLVGYGPCPNEVIDLVREGGIASIAGNYDDGVAFERGGCGCYYPDEEARRIGDASYAFTVAAVTPARKEWLRSLPRELRVTMAGLELHLVHGSPRRINEYLLKARDRRTFLRLADAEDADVLLFGHTHEQWHRRFGDVLFVNVGSVGRPKDGDPRAAYTVLSSTAGGGPVVDFVRIAYDVEGTVRAVLAAGLSETLADAFRSGH